MSDGSSEIGVEPAMPQRVICEHAILPSVAFKIAVDPHALTGEDGQPQDPISAGYLRNEANLNQHLLDLMLRFLEPGQCLLDLGAHIGTFALTAAARGCRVCAVEASPRNFSLLCASVRHNGWSERVRVIHAAVGDTTGELSFSAYGPWGHVATPKTGMAAVRVPALRIDDLIAQEGIERIDFIKIDVEGSEVAALQGASSLLRWPSAPPILYESNYLGLDYYGKSPRDLRATLVGLGYAHHYLIHDRRLISVSPEELQGEVVGEYLASKTPLRSVAGWSIEARLSQDELIEFLVANCRVEARYRIQLGRALRKAPRDLLGRAEVIALLDGLLADPSQEVRRAVNWWRWFGQRLWHRLLGRLRRARAG
jgi:FkbM family methyltransferase